MKKIRHQIKFQLNGDRMQIDCPLKDPSKCLFVPVTGEIEDKTASPSASLLVSIVNGSLPGMGNNHAAGPGRSISTNGNYAQNRDGDINHIRLAQAALESSEARLRALSARLLTTQESERKQLASLLHDSIGQNMTAIKYGIETVQNKLKTDPAQPIGAEIESALSICQSVIDEVRQVRTGLRPPVLDDLGILPAISWHCRELEGIYSQFKIKRNIRVDEKDIPEDMKIVIYRILQEAMSNAVRHSRGAIVIVSLEKTNWRLTLKISDNGDGFDLHGQNNQTAKFGRLGLATMKERAEFSGGEFKIITSPGTGTTVQVDWPMAK